MASLGPASLAALARIAARANDVLAAYAPGAEPAFTDVRVPGTPIGAVSALSVAAPPNALFVTAGPAGERTYTRDGRFALRDGRLTAPNGDAVLGIPAGSPPGTAPAPLAADPRDTALGRTASAQIAADGTVSYERSAIDPRTGDRRTERVVLGRLALARFPAGSELATAGGGRLAAPRGSVPFVGVPADGTFGTLVPHARDVGAIDLTTALVKLQDAYLAFDALRAANVAGNGTVKTAMDLVK